MAVGVYASDATMTRSGRQHLLIDVVEAELVVTQAVD
jgi:hypothetical protein